ncbi:MAG: DUF6056 family protein [Bacteroidetes bacterium]|nr:DUF6056 family protein [Bacteroidota bacterium]
MRILKLLSLLSLAGILLLSFFSWYSCDDICNRNELLRYSVPHFMWLQYMNWDGRSLSIAAFLQQFSLQHFPVEITVLLWALSFTGCGFMIYKIIRNENPGFENGNSPLLVVAIICVTMWLGMWKLIPDVIYWSTGGSYSLLALLGLVWIYFFLKKLHAGKTGWKDRLFIFFLSLICGVNSHNYVSALIILTMIEWFYDRVSEKNKSTSAFIPAALAGLVISASVVFFSPGNQVRLHAVAYHGYSVHFLFYYFLVLARYCYWLLALFVLCFFVMWISGENKFYTELKKIKAGWRTKFFILQFLHEHKFLVAAFATILVFSATPVFAVPRTGIFFAVFFVLYVFERSWKTGFKTNSKNFIPVAAVYFGIFISILSYQLINAGNVKEELAGRERLYEQSKGMDVAVAAIPGRNIPFAFTYTDISEDTSYWVNRCVAQYYQLKTVKSGMKEASGDVR